MRCRDLIEGLPYAGLESDSVRTCAQIMKDRQIGFLPIVDMTNRLVGVLTDRDIALRVVAEGQPFTTTARDVMTRDVLSVHPDDELTYAEDKLAAWKKSRVPLVTESGMCVGVISLADISQHESRKRAGEILRAVTRRETKPEVPLDLM
jgi:CBS domain-containing protein